MGRSVIVASSGLSQKEKSLKRRLDKLLRAFDARYLQSDPLCFVHRYAKREDQEVVGLIASSLAYGKVAGIKKSVERVLAIMGTRPASFAARFSPATHASLFDGFVHRFNGGADVACLIYFIRQMMETSGSIGGFFLKGYDKGYSKGNTTSSESPIKRALNIFTGDALSLDSAPVYGQKRLGDKAGVRYFFPAPSKGSACKRLNLYLRWMVRPADGLDLGLWTDVDPADLIIPIDTHLGRISRNLGLTARKSADWKCAEEVTARLARLDPADPLKYDFALCRLGILDRCPKRVDPVKCAECLIKEICVL